MGMCVWVYVYFILYLDSNICIEYYFLKQSKYIIHYQHMSFIEIGFICFPYSYVSVMLWKKQMQNLDFTYQHRINSVEIFIRNSFHKV